MARLGESTTEGNSPWLCRARWQPTTTLLGAYATTARICVKSSRKQQREFRTARNSEHADALRIDFRLRGKPAERRLEIVERNAMKPRRTEAECRNRRAPM